jgi:hypothetical protein
VPTPTFTGLDAATQGIAGLLFLIVGLGAWSKAPADSRTRVFLGVAIANAITYGVQATAWLSGLRQVFSLPRGALAALFCGLSLGSLLLFHFCQVFPWRRPWIQKAGWTLRPAYALILLATAALVLLVPSNFDDFSPPILLGTVALGLPLLLLVGVALPLSAIVSLVKSYREAAGADRRAMRVPLLWLLISQIAGGTISVLFAPVLALVAPNTAAQTALTITVWLLGLMTPAAFALAVWTYGLPDDYLK